MTKTKLVDKSGKVGKEIELPKNFSAKIRADILAKVFEAQRGMHMSTYGSMPGAGAGYSASGILKHRRHAWKSTYGKGISRIPRKIFSRHGASFNWAGATVSNTRGGRRPHAPKAEKNMFRKINKKEFLIAFNSALTGTFDANILEMKYGKKVSSGFVFDSAVLNLKTKEFLAILRNLFGESFDRVLKQKSVRAGMGKLRGRKYKSTPGMLFVVGDKEKMNRKGIDVLKVKDLTIKDLAPNGEAGRLVCYTETATKEIGELFGGKKK